MSDSKPLNLMVLCGGVSEEREVSLDSGKAVFEGLLRLGHTASVFDAADLSPLTSGAGEFMADCPALSPTSDDEALAKLGAHDFSGIDVVFVMLHGGAGEDGRAQAALEKTGVRYTGSGPEASALSLDKPQSKRCARTLDIPTADWIKLDLDEPGADAAAGRIVSEIGLPCVIKPARGGSTVGLTLAREEREIPGAIEALREVSHLGMAERYLAGREMTVAVFDGKAWPVVEITPSSGLYDYHAKYTSGGSEYTSPAKIPEERSQELQRDSATIYRALGCSGLARVDFILDENGQRWFLELNTIPGLTELSLAPMSAAAAGVGFDQLLQMMADSALAR